MAQDEHLRMMPDKRKKILRQKVLISASKHLPEVEKHLHTHRCAAHFCKGPEGEPLAKRSKTQRCLTPSYIYEAPPGCFTINGAFPEMAIHARKGQGTSEQLDSVSFACSGCLRTGTEEKAQF